jgi:hypothetical protein
MASLATSAQAATNLIQNGGFEINGGPGFIDLPPAEAGPQALATTIANWSSDRDVPAGRWGFNQVTSLAWLNSQNYYYFGLWGATPGYQNGNGFTTSPNGGWFVSSDGFDRRSAIEQTVSGLEVGTEYTLYYEYAYAQENGVPGDSNNFWHVSFGPDAITSTPLLTPSTGFDGWFTDSQTFTAKSTSQVLSFLAYGTNGVPPYLLLDGVSLTRTHEVPGPVPVLGAAGVLAWSRKLRRRIQSTGARQVGSSAATRAS